MVVMLCEVRNPSDMKRQKVRLPPQYTSFFGSLKRLKNNFAASGERNPLISPCEMGVFHHKRAMLCIFLLRLGFAKSAATAFYAHRVLCSSLPHRQVCPLLQHLVVFNLTEVGRFFLRRLRLQRKKPGTLLRLGHLWFKWEINQMSRCL